MSDSPENWHKCALLYVQHYVLLEIRRKNVGYFWDQVEQRRLCLFVKIAYIQNTEPLLLWSRPKNPEMYS
jgi:hypothetical protein